MKVGRGDDKQLMYLLTDAITLRDEIIMRGILHELREAFSGKVEPRDNQLIGASWVTHATTERIIHKLEGSFNQCRMVF